MKRHKLLGWLLGGLIAFGILFGRPPGSPVAELPLERDEDRALALRVEAGPRRTDASSDARVGEVLSYAGAMPAFGPAELQRLLRRVPARERGLGLSWNDGSGGIVAFSVGNTEGSHRFASGYLTRWQPFAAEQLWMPWYAVARRLRYQYDHEQFPGREEVWQTPLQSWQRGVGDCEDHALLLADWLLNAGEDARVVLGTYRGEGHAWVVVIRDGTAYLLEATQKFGRGALRQYPLAALLTDYQPELMFNRDDLWVNEGAYLTTDYTGQRWRKASWFREFAAGEG